MIDSDVPPTISVLEKIPRKHEYLVRLSDGGELRVTDDDLARFALAPGLGLNAELRDRLARAYEHSKARQAALRLVKVRPRTEGELARALRSRGFADDAVAGVIGDLVARGIVDDRLFARLWVAERVGRGVGRRRILSELRSKSVDEAAALGELESQYGADEESENARRAALKRLGRLGSLEREKLERRLYDYLVRQGFSSGIAREATRHALASSGRKGEA
jgi:regulatory protein